MKIWIAFALIFGMFCEFALCVSAAIDSEIDGNGISISIQADDTVRTTDRFLTVIYPPNVYTGNFSVDNVCFLSAADNIAADKISDCKYYFDDISLYGSYTAAVYRTDADGVTALVHVKTLKRISFDDIANCVKAFQEATTGDFQTIATLYIDTNEYIIVEDGLKNYAAMAPYFVLARDGYKKKIWTGDFQTIEDTNDIVSCMEAARLLLALQKGSEEDIKTYGELWGSRLGGLLDSTVDFNTFAKVYRPATEETEENIAKRIQLAQLASKMYNGTRANIAAVLEEYADVLGIDVEYLAEKNVTFSDVAPYIDSTMQDNYIDNIAQKVKGIADELVSARENVSGSNSSRKSGSGGSGGVTVLPKPEAIQPIEPSQQTTDDIVLPFTDLQGYDWAHEAISELYEKNIINGKGNGYFCPGEAVKREEFVKMLISAAGINTVEQTSFIFADCDSSEWFFPYVEAAYRNEIVLGVSKDAFGVGMNITRQDTAVMCANALRHFKKSLTSLGKLEYTDSDDIAAYAQEAVSALTENKIFGGFEDGSFQGGQYVTRAECTVILKRLSRILEEK